MTNLTEEQKQEAIDRVVTTLNEVYVNDKDALYWTMFVNAVPCKDPNNFSRSDIDDKMSGGGLINTILEAAIGRRVGMIFSDVSKVTSRDPQNVDKFLGVAAYSEEMNTAESERLDK